MLVRVVTPESGRPFELGDDRIERAVLVMRRAEIAQVGVRLPPSRSARSSVSRDLPIPGSPDSSTTRPSPLAACRQRRSSNSSSSSRPTSGVVAARKASKRLSTPLGPSTRHAGTGSENPLSAICPRSSQSNRLPTSWRVLAANHNGVGLGDPFQATRKLRSFADNPMLIRAIAEEIADHDGAGGDADPQLKGPGTAAIKLGDRLDQGETGTDRAFDVVLVRLRIAEIGQHLRPRELAHRAARPRDDRRAATLVGSDQRLQLLRIKSGRELARAGKIADKNRDLPALRRAGVTGGSISTSQRDLAAASAA